MRCLGVVKHDSLGREQHVVHVLCCLHQHHDGDCKTEEQNIREMELRGKAKCMASEVTLDDIVAEARRVWDKHGNIDVKETSSTFSTTIIVRPSRHVNELQTVHVTDYQRANARAMALAALKALPTAKD